MNGPDGYQVHLRLVGPKGKYLLNLSHQVSGMFESGVDPTKAPKPADDDPTLEKDEASQAVADYFRAQASARGGPTDSTALVKHLSNPEKNEPLSIGLVGALRTLEKQKKPAVILASDFAFAATILGGMSGQRSTLGAWKRSLEMIGHETVADSGWMLMRPAKPMEAERLFIPRRVLTEILKEYQTQGRLSLAFRAALSLKLPDEPQMSIAFLYLLAAGLDTFGGDTEWLRLYALLNADQRGTLLKKEPLGLTQFNAAQLQQIERMIYAPRWDHGFSENIDTVESSGERFWGPSARTEPTERFPDGLPPTLQLSANVVAGPGVFPATDNRFGYNYPSGLDATGLAWQLITKERPDLFPWASNQPEFKEFHLGKRENWNFSLSLDPKVSMAGQLNDSVVDRAKRLAFKDLPEDFRKEVDEHMKRLRESYKDAKPGDFGGSRAVPPPSR
jgi:hypothetical protein